MTYAQYFIGRDGDDWTIRFENEVFGPYNSREQAMLFAVDAAQKLGDAGRSTQICLMGEGGHFSPEWTYGQA